MTPRGAAAVSVPTGLDEPHRREDTAYGTKEMAVRDPDGRLWNLQAPAGN
ncbi:hypothetical protein [Streptomyces sp. NPDC054786]